MPTLLSTPAQVWPLCYRGCAIDALPLEDHWRWRCGALHGKDQGAARAMPHPAWLTAAVRAKEMSTPMKRVEAKPTMMLAAKVLPNQYRMAQVIMVETLESRIEGQARAKPASTAAAIERPARSSSLVRSKIRMLASTAMPIERINPAMPASVKVTGMSLKVAKTTRA